jgi:hypothetical protein
MSAVARRALDFLTGCTEHPELGENMDERHEQGSVNPADVEPLAAPEEYLQHVRRSAEEPHEAHDHGDPTSESVREDEYKGHRIVVRTSYTIEVDGRPVTGHVAVTNDGQVHYHAVPNLSFASVVDLVRELIDAFSEDFAGPDDAGEETYDEMELGHDHEHGEHGQDKPRHGKPGHGKHEHGGKGTGEGAYERGEG